MKMGADEPSPLTTPITKSFLEKILNRKVAHFTSSVGSNPGDNYTSVLISLEVIPADSQKPLYLLFKTFPNHPTRQKLLEDTNLFLKEYQVYDLWLPELQNLQKNVIKNHPILTPAMPELVAGAAIDYSKGDPTSWEALGDSMLNNFVLMVDVRKTHGFKMANKLESLGYHHVKVVLEELAKYHALGYAYKVHHKLTSVQSQFPFMEDPFFCNVSQKPTLEAMLKMNMTLVMDTCQGFLENNPEIFGSLSKFKDGEKAVEYMHIFLNPEGMDEEKVEGLMRTKPKEYSDAPLKEQWIVAGHGDCWTNNMLFKTGPNGKVETVLVDLQIARESCIMADLVYFVYTSTDSTFRKKYLAEMLQWYYEKFAGFCEILRVQPFEGFTLENFRRKFHRSKIFGFLFASLVLPIILQRPETTVNLDSVESGCSGNESEDIADMFGKMGRDDDDLKLLRQRFTSVLQELHEEGVL